MILPLIQLLHSFVLWILQFHPYPEFFIYPYLTSHGFLPYKNILDQHFPGIMFFPVNLNTLGFISPDSLKILMILVVIVQSAFIYKIARSFASRRIAIIACTLFAIWQPFFDGNQFWINSLLPLFLLPAFYFFYEKKWPMVGIFLGIAIIFKQTLVPLALLVSIYIFFTQNTNRWKSFFSYSLIGIIPSLLMLGYLYKIGVLSDFFFWTIKFNLTTYAKEATLAPTFGQLARLTLPVALLFQSFFVSKFSKLSKLSGFWAVASIIGGITRFEFIHFLPAIPFFCISIAILISNWIDNKNIIVICASTLLTLIWIFHFYYHQTGYLTIRYFEPNVLQTVDIIKSKTDPGDKIFLLGLHPHIYALSQTFPPDKLFVFQLPWFLHVAGNRVLSALQNDHPKLVAYDSASRIDGQYLRDYAPDLVQYVTSHYQITGHLESITFYESWH